MLRPLLQNNLSAVRERVAHAARCAGRDPASVQIVAVTKSVGPKVALELAKLCISDASASDPSATDSCAGAGPIECALGENRVDRLERKAADFETAGVEVCWHFIGHVQGNKARRVVRLADAIHSVDSLELLERLDRIAGEEGRSPRVFLEVKLSHEESKQGFARAEVSAAARAAAQAANLRFTGLMTMAPAPDRGHNSEKGANDQAARGVFDELVRIGHALEAELGDALANEELLYSMGMSDDFEQAVQAGSHFVRVGGALFAGLDRDELERDVLQAAFPPPGADGEAEVRG